jgi:hypothetical protein
MEWSDHTAAFHFCYKMGRDCCAGAPNVQTTSIYLDVLIKMQLVYAANSFILAQVLHAYVTMKGFYSHTSNYNSTAFVIKLAMYMYSSAFICILTCMTYYIYHKQTTIYAYMCMSAYIRYLQDTAVVRSIGKL